MNIDQTNFEPNLADEIQFSFTDIVVYRMKRWMDIGLSAFILFLVAPIVAFAAALIFIWDGHSPFFTSERIGRHCRRFKMVKLRSMVVDADKLGGTSTGSDDPRTTWPGRLVRRFKFDELTQLYAVLKGDMSLVGPRPQVWDNGVERYTQAEYRLLSVRPGITDFASIVFADEGDILAGQPDPDETYNRIIRPWKSRLALFYIDHACMRVDLRLIWLTLIAVFSHRDALQGVSRLLQELGADPALVDVARRDKPIPAISPPGSEPTVREFSAVSTAPASSSKPIPDLSRVARTALSHPTLGGFDENLDRRNG